MDSANMVDKGVNPLEWNMEKIHHGTTMMTEMGLPKAMVTLRLEMSIQPSSSGIHSNSSMMSMMASPRQSMSLSSSSVGDVMHPVKVTVEYPEDIQVNVNAVIVGSSSSNMTGSINDKTMPFSSSAEMQKMKDKGSRAPQYNGKLHSSSEPILELNNSVKSDRHVGGGCGTEVKADDGLDLDHHEEGGGGGGDDTMYQTVLMGNDSLTGCAILDSHIKFGDLSVINPTPTSSSGLFSMQANAGSVEDFDDEGRQEQDGFDVDDQGHGDQEGDEGDGVYPYRALTDTEEGQELELKVFEEQERAISGSLGFDLDSKAHDDVQQRSSRPMGSTPKPVAKSRSILVNSSHSQEDYDVTGVNDLDMSSSFKKTVSFNNTEEDLKHLVHQMVGKVARGMIKNEYITNGPEFLFEHPQKSLSEIFTRKTVPVPAKFVKKACLSTTFPMKSRKIATTELRSFSTKKPDPMKDNCNNTLIYDDQEKRRCEKQDACTESFYGKVEEEDKKNYWCDGPGTWHKPHSCYICFPVPDDAIELLKEKIGLTTKEAREAAYELFMYLKEQRHTGQAQEVMKKIQPDLFKGRVFAARRFDDED